MDRRPRTGGSGAITGITAGNTAATTTATIGVTSTTGAASTTGATTTVGMVTHGVTITGCTGASPPQPPRRRVPLGRVPAPPPRGRSASPPAPPVMVDR
jgi:hypothetical protein